VRERLKREVGCREPPLREKGTEHERRVVAALPRLLNLHVGEVVGANLSDAFGSFSLGYSCHFRVVVVSLRARNRLRERQRRLR
jgi:hypothetical protein